jgi:hypothetical protein
MNGSDTMTATLHPLHPELTARTGSDTPASQIMHSLEQMALGVINEQLRVMFEGADDLLFEMADKTRKGPEQQLFLDTMRIVRMERPRILKSFQNALHDAFGRNDSAPAATAVNLDDLEHWSLQDSTELEEKIAVTNMDSKASSLYANELMELEQRLSSLADQTGGAVSSQALSPLRILEAFQQSMKGLDVEFPIKLVIYKLFDRVVVSNLGRVFHDANQLLETRGVTPKQPVKPKKPATTRSQAGQDFTMTTAMQPYLYPETAPQATGAPAGTPAQYIAGVDTQRLAEAMAPHSFGAAPAANGGGTAGGYGNPQLASEMLAVIDAVGHGRPVSSWMPAQNLALVGRMFDDFYSDPRMPEAARPLMGRLQFPAMKVALSDTGFFADPSHPVRALLQDVFSMLTNVRNRDQADYRALEELIQNLLQRIDVDPARLRQNASETRAVTEDQAEQFLNQQNERLEAQRSAMKEKVRRIVSQEIRLHIGERRIPRPAMPLLLSGIAPMLASAYLRGGERDRGWEETLNLLDGILDSFDPQTAASTNRAEYEAGVISAVSQRLLSAGHPEDKVQTLLNGLVEAYLKLSTSDGGELVQIAPAPESAPETGALPQPRNGEAGPALPLLLRHGEWFRVWDAGNRYCHWLKLTAYHAAHDAVLFEDFGAENLLKMRATAFVHDLAAGRSSPVDPESSTRQLIALLPKPPEPPVASGAVWQKVATAASGTTH